MNSTCFLLIIVAIEIGSFTPIAVHKVQVFSKLFIGTKWKSWMFKLFHTSAYTWLLHCTDCLPACHVTMLHCLSVLLMLSYTLEYMSNSTDKLCVALSKSSVYHIKFWEDLQCAESKSRKEATTKKSRISFSQATTQKSRISFSEKTFMWKKLVILSRDVPGLSGLSRDICPCPCPGTKGHRDKESVLVPGQRDSGTSRPGMSRDVPSLGNARMNL